MIIYNFKKHQKNKNQKFSNSLKVYILLIWIIGEIVKSFRYLFFFNYNT